MKTKYSTEEWRNIIAEWKAEDMTRKEFCESKKLKVTTFDYWRRKLGKNGSDDPRMVRISGPLPPHDDPFIVHIETFLKIEVPPTFDESSLVRLVQALRELS